MAKKTVLAIFLIVLGVSTGLLSILAYATGVGSATITLTILAVAIGVIIVGTILGFSRLLDKMVNPVLDEIHQDLEDDIQDLKERRITNTFVMIIIVGIAAIVFSFFVLRFDKLEAMWGSIPVVLPTIVGVLFLVWYIPRTFWFQHFDAHTPMVLFLIPTIGFAITLVIGITKTENLNSIMVSGQESIEYNDTQSDGSFFLTAAQMGIAVFEAEIPICGGDDSGIFLVIALIVLAIILTIILVIGSALIPHFWLFSGSILLGIMAFIVIHDLRVRRAS